MLIFNHAHTQTGMNAVGAICRSMPRLRIHFGTQTGQTTLPPESELPLWTLSSDLNDMKQNRVILFSVVVLQNEKGCTAGNNQCTLVEHW